MGCGWANLLNNEMQIRKDKVKMKRYLPLILNGEDFKLHAIYTAKCNLQITEKPSKNKQAEHFDKNRFLNRFL